jgi:hypothetical protein
MNGKDGGLQARTSALRLRRCASADSGRLIAIAQGVKLGEAVLPWLSVIAYRAMAKSPCPMTKTQFLDKAEPVKITIGSAELVADKREFSTGSFGWYYNGKTTITVDGKPLSIQIGLNLTVVGSKEAER